MTMRILELDTWERKEHFQFFSQFEEPFFGVCTELDCTIAYQKSKQTGTSFFLYYLHKSLVAVNQTEPFRYRIDANNNVIVHETIAASATINRENGTFGFSYMPYYEEYEAFESVAKLEIERIRNSTSIFPPQSTDDVIHCSSIPWIKFTSLSHARKFSFNDSCPKISFGKMTEFEGRRSMPVSIHVHHALMDGWHVGQFLEKFQNLLDA